MPLALRFLGAIQVTWNDAPLKFATDHVRALLAYLAVEADEIHPRTTLATLLWPEENEATARRNLRQALLFLKQALAAVPQLNSILHITATTVQWNTQDVAVDLHTFQHGWRQSQNHNHGNQQLCNDCLDHLVQATALYQGELLHGLLLKQSLPFEEWMLLLREQTHRQMMTMLTMLTSHYATMADYARVQQVAARQVLLEPWHEKAHRYLMQALAAQGQQSAALRQYERCRRTLQQELGVPPSAETTQLYEQIRAGKLRLPSEPSSQTELPKAEASSSPLGQSQVEPAKRLHNLPANLPPLVGRSQELEQLRTLLRIPSHRLLTIVGMGGMGKSRLALALLEELHTESPLPYPHGVWFVPLTGVAANPLALPSAVAGTILNTLGVTTPNQDDLQRALFHYLAQRQLLLVFDSVEQLLIEDASATATTDFLLALLQAAPGATLVVTSRLSLQLLAESVVRLEGLPIPTGEATRAKLGEAANYESVRLFVYHAQRTLPAFTLNHDNLPSVIELCRALSGMPLAIELAAALAPHFTPNEMVAAIGQNLALLVSSRRDIEARHRHFSAVLQSSWQQLSTSEQQVLAQSSIFVGRFSRAAIQAVTGATISDLTSLVDKSLIQQPGVGVYQLHNLLRQFATDKLQENRQEAIAVADRHSAFYLRFVAAREKQLARHAPREAVEEIQAEVDNVRQAWAWAITQLVQRFPDVAISAWLDASAYSLWQFYLITGLYAEGVAVFQQAVEGIQTAIRALNLANSAELVSKGTIDEDDASDRELRRWQQLLSKLLAINAYMLSIHGKYLQSLTIAEQAIVVGVAYGSPEGELIGLIALAQAHHRNGKPEQAKVYGEQALQAIQAHQWGTDPGEYYYDAQLIVHLYLGVIAKNADDFAQASDHLTQALALCKQLGKVRGEMHARLNFANLARYKQNYRAARQDYEQVLQIACELGYRWGEAATRYELADVMRGQGDYLLAIEQLERMLAIVREMGEPFLENYAVTDLGRLYAFLGDYERAWELVKQALKRSEGFSMPDAKQDTWLAAALLHHQAGENTEALVYAMRSQQAAQESGSVRYEGCAWLYVGYALAGLTRWTEATAAYTHALQLYQQLDIQPTVAEAQAGLARMALVQDDRIAALRWVEKILSIMHEHTTVGLDEPFLIYLTCYRVLTANADPRATEVLQAGVDTLQRYAKQITDIELRRSFEEEMPVHRELRAAGGNPR